MNIERSWILTLILFTSKLPLDSQPLELFAII